MTPAACPLVAAARYGTFAVRRATATLSMTFKTSLRMLGAAAVMSANFPPLARQAAQGLAAPPLAAISLTDAAGPRAFTGRSHFTRAWCGARGPLRRRCRPGCGGESDDA